MADFVGHSKEKLDTLEEEDSIYIGRKKSLHSKYKKEGALLLGKSMEEANYGKYVYMDALAPHVVFICGSRGSGKSYSLGVIAEELVLKNPNIACVVIDPIGIFWSMKYPNKEDKELEDLGKWGLEPNGIDTTQVFIPLGMKKKIPKGTYDKLFSIRPADLTVDEWCLTFGIDRFSPTGLLLEKAIEKTKEKFKGNYGLEDLIKTIEKDPELTGKERGYRQDTRRALSSRFEAAKAWGILSKEGTSLAEVCKEGHVSVIDISFLEENVSSLVIGMFARKILNARKLLTRKSAVEKYALEDIDDLLNVEIPPTWLFIDEAHTLIPSGTSKTAASDSLIEYVKQGRRPGCSLVFATQQPSAIDTKVLSQLDLLLCHKLVFDEDLKAVVKRMPTLLPIEYEKGRFLKTLPIGIALLGDRSEETSRAFSIQIRPRFSQHEGREIHTIELEEKVDPERIRELLVSLIDKRLQEMGNLSLQKIDEIVNTMSRRYDLKLNSDKIIDILLKQRGYRFEDGMLFIPGFEKQRELAAEIGEELRALNIRIDKEKAKTLAEKNRKKKILGFIGKGEEIEDMELVYMPIYKISFELKLKKGYRPMNIFVDSDYEVYYYDKKFKKTKDVKEVIDLNEKAIKVLEALKKTDDQKKIAKMSGLAPQAVGRHLNNFVKSGLVKKDEKKRHKLAKKLDIPEEKRSDKFTRFGENVSVSKLTTSNFEEIGVNEKTIKKIPEIFWGCKAKSVETLFKPVWKVTYHSDSGIRIQKFDAI